MQLQIVRQVWGMQELPTASVVLHTLAMRCCNVVLVALGFLVVKSCYCPVLLLALLMIAVASGDKLSWRAFDLLGHVLIWCIAWGSLEVPLMAVLLADISGFLCCNMHNTD